jgi:copper resistance protein D
MDAIFSIWSWIRWIHLVSAIAWIGGQLFILIVLLPIMRTTLPRDERVLVFAQVGRRYATVSWVALTLLIITGFLNGQRRSVDWEHLTRSGYGQILFTKLIFVAIIIVVTLVHALYFGRRITELAERSKELGQDDPGIAAERRRLQILSGVLSGANLLLNLVVVLLAAALVA